MQLNVFSLAETIREDKPQIYKKLVLRLDASRDNEVFEIVGDGMYVLDATDTGVSVDVRFSEIEADAITLIKRKGVRLPFYRFFVTHAAQAGKTITIILMRDLEMQVGVIDFSAAQDVNSILQPVQTKQPATLNVSAVVVGIVAVQILAANLNRKKFTSLNNGATDLYFGKDGTVTTANGFGKIVAGQAWDSEYTGAVWAIGSAAVGDLRVMEEVF